MTDKKPTNRGYQPTPPKPPSSKGFAQDGYQPTKVEPKPVKPPPKKP